MPITKQHENLSYFQMSLFNKKISTVNFHVDIFKFDFLLNYYMLGDKPNTANFKLSHASFHLLKKLARLFPQNPDIINEKMLCINSYSHQQQLNIYRSFSRNVELIRILYDGLGISRIYVHKCICCIKISYHSSSLKENVCVVI